MNNDNSWFIFWFMFCISLSIILNLANLIVKQNTVYRIQKLEEAIEVQTVPPEIVVLLKTEEKNDEK